MDIKKMRSYAFDEAMDTLAIVCDRKARAKRSPFVDLMFLRRYASSANDVIISAAIDGMEYWTRLALKYHPLVYQVDHATTICLNLIYEHFH